MCKNDVMLSTCCKDEKLNAGNKGEKLNTAKKDKLNIDYKNEKLYTTKNDRFNTGKMIKIETHVKKWKSYTKVKKMRLMLVIITNFSTFV